MRILILAALLIAPIPGRAASFFENASKLVAEKVKETMPVGLFGLNVKPSGSAWLPIWRFHADGNPKIEYFNFGIGGEWNKDLRGGEAYIGGMHNLVALSGKFWDFDWAKRHVKRSKFPALYFGPSLMLPFDAAKIEKTFSSMDEFLKRGRLMVGIKF